MFLPMQPGTEDERRIRLLLKLVKFSDNTQEALVRHFVTGMAIDTVACLYDIKQSNLTRSIQRLNEVNHIHEQIKELEIYHLTEQGKQGQGSAAQ